jgi:DNA-directed RNA polymerase subunit RPC12/RpoP
VSAVAGGEDDGAGQNKERRCMMPTGLIPVVIIAVGFIVQFFFQRNVLTRYDYQCGSCGATFSPAALSLALAPHRPVGRKYMRCPQCGRWSWVTPVPKG